MDSAVVVISSGRCGGDGGVVGDGGVDVSGDGAAGVLCTAVLAVGVSDVVLSISITAGLLYWRDGCHTLCVPLEHPVLLYWRLGSHYWCCPSL